MHRTASKRCFGITTSFRTSCSSEHFSVMYFVTQATLLDHKKLFINYKSTKSSKHKNHKTRLQQIQHLIMTSEPVTDFTGQGISALVEQFESAIRRNSSPKCLSPLPPPRRRSRSPRSSYTSDLDISDNNSVSSLLEESHVQRMSSASSNMIKRISFTNLEGDEGDEQDSLFEESSRRQTTRKSRNTKIWIFVGHR